MNISSQCLADEYALAYAAKQADKIRASRDKTQMPEQYWQGTHVARLKLNAAQAIREAMLGEWQRDA